MTDSEFSECSLFGAEIMPLPPCPPKKLALYFRLIATLPRRAANETDGKIIFGMFMEYLGKLPEEKIVYICDKVIRSCEWMPTVAECLRIGEGWMRDDVVYRAQMMARHKARQEATARRIECDSADYKKL